MCKLDLGIEKYLKNIYNASDLLLFQCLVREVQI